MDRIKVTVQPLEKTADLNLIKEELEARFNKTEFAKSSFEILDKLNHINIVAPFDSKNENELKRFRQLFESTKLELWDAFLISDDKVQILLESLPEIDGFFHNHNLQYNPYGKAVIGTCQDANSLLKISETISRHLISNSKMRPLWSINKQNYLGDSEGAYYLYLANDLGQTTAEITEANINEIGVGIDPHYGDAVINLSFDKTGSANFQMMTRQAASAGNRSIIIAINDGVFLAPAVQSEILDGHATIAPFETIADAQDLVFKIKLGRLRYPIQVISEEIIKKEK